MSGLCWSVAGIVERQGLDYKKATFEITHKTSTVDEHCIYNQSNSCKLNLPSMPLYQNCKALNSFVSGNKGLQQLL